MTYQVQRRGPVWVAASALALLAGCDSTLPRESRLLGDLSLLERRGGGSEQLLASGDALSGVRRVVLDHSHLAVGEGSPFGAISASGRQRVLQHTRAALARELADELEIVSDPAEHGPDLLVLRTSIVDVRTPRDGSTGLDLGAARFECEGRSGESDERLFALVLPADAAPEPASEDASAVDRSVGDPSARDLAIVDDWARQLADWIAEHRSR